MLNRTLYSKVIDNNMLREFKIKQPLTVGLMVIALVQGLGLLGLHQAIEHHVWPFPHAHWLMGLYSFFMVTPTMLLLLLGEGVTKQRVLFTLGYGALAGLLGLYVGSQVGDRGFDYASNIIFGFVVSMGIASFIALMLIQSRTSQSNPLYEQMFQYSWRNALTLSLAWAFVLCFWGVLMLWAKLFEMINISFFYDLFTEKWFFYPVLTLAQGTGILLLTRKTHLIDSMAGIIQILMKYLLVVLAFVSILFLFFLPIKGLDSLWNAGGSFLILTLQALLLFIVNAVYQGKSESPYIKWVDRLVSVAIVLLPIYSIISLYGLSLRIEQYGWTLDRCWAILVWALITLFVVSYAIAIFRLKGAWASQMGSINKVSSWVMMVVLLIINSPVLDFRKITLSSQLARLDSKEVSPKDFDYRYLRNQLGEPGFIALEQLQARFEAEYPVVSDDIKALIENTQSKSIKTKEDFVAFVELLDGTTLPDGFTDALYKWAQESTWRLEHVDGFFVKAINLDGQGDSEYLLIERQGHYDTYWLFYLEQETWKSLTFNQHWSENKKPKLSPNELMERLSTGEFTLKPSQWSEVHVDDLILSVPPAS